MRLCNDDKRYVPRVAVRQSEKGALGGTSKRARQPCHDAVSGFNYLQEAGVLQESEPHFPHGVS